MAAKTDWHRYGMKFVTVSLCIGLHRATVT